MWLGLVFIIYGGELTIMKKTVQAGALSDAASTTKKFLDKLIDGMGKWLDIKGWERKDEGEVELNNNIYTKIKYLSGNNDVVYAYIRPDEEKEKYVHLIVEYKKKLYPCKHNPIKESQIFDYMTEFMDKFDLGSNEGEQIEVDSSDNVRVTLKKVTAGTTAKIHLGAINPGRYSIKAAIDMLNDVLADDEFASNVPEESTSYEISEVADADEYDVNQIDNDAVDLTATYLHMLESAVIMQRDFQSIMWGASGHELHELRRQIESRMWDCSRYIDVLAELVVEKTQQIPHLSNFCDTQTIPDLSVGFDLESGLRVAQHSAKQFIDTLEGYYVNLDHDIQDMIDVWLRDLKKWCDYFVERQISPTAISETTPAVVESL